MLKSLPITCSWTNLPNASPSRVALNDCILHLAHDCICYNMYEHMSAIENWLFTMRTARNTDICFISLSKEFASAILTRPASPAKQLNSSAIKNHLGMPAGCCIIHFQPCLGFHYFVQMLNSIIRTSGTKGNLIFVNTEVAFHKLCMFIRISSFWMFHLCKIQRNHLGIVHSVLCSNMWRVLSGFLNVNAHHLPEWHI